MHVMESVCACLTSERKENIPDLRVLSPFFLPSSLKLASFGSSDLMPGFERKAIKF